jgi:NAD(P)H-hydrate repair Nnr-like enzyme with NAD(P)H-hydrate epimerase domain
MCGSSTMIWSGVQIAAAPVVSPDMTSGMHPSTAHLSVVVPAHIRHANTSCFHQQQPNIVLD